MSSHTVETETTQASQPSLNAEDRCDRCGAQAYTEIAVPVRDTFLPLTLCGHHFTEHETKILSAGHPVIDERWRLTRRPS